MRISATAHLSSKLFPNEKNKSEFLSLRFLSLLLLSLVCYFCRRLRLFQSVIALRYLALLSLIIISIGTEQLIE